MSEIEEQKIEEIKNETINIMRIEKIYNFGKKYGTYLHNKFYTGNCQFYGLSFDLRNFDIRNNVNVEISKIFEKLEIRIIKPKDGISDYYDEKTGGCNLNDVETIYVLDKYKLNNKFGNGSNSKILNNSILTISGLTGEYKFLIDYKIYDYYYMLLKEKIELNFVIIETIEK